MIYRLRERMGREEGFTLVELLVVMLILGILAAIAIPSFFSQRDKARDADSKATVRTAQTAAETYATGNDGEYTTAMTVAELRNIEETLPATGLAVATPATVNALAGDTADNSYTVTMTSDTGNTFSITRHSDGTTELTCTAAGTAGCPGSGGGTGTWG